MGDLTLVHHDHDAAGNPDDQCNAKKVSGSVDESVDELTFAQCGFLGKPTNDPDQDGETTDPTLIGVVDNPDGSFNHIVRGYKNGDTDMNGKMIYQGLGNDVDKMIFLHVLLHPGNSATAVNYFVTQQLP